MKKTFDCILVWQIVQPMNSIVVINYIEIERWKNHFKLVNRSYTCLFSYAPTEHKCILIWSIYYKYILFSSTGFHLSATVAGTQPRAQFNVAVTFDRRRISSCNCTCSSTAYWCSHVVAVCLHRIHCVCVWQIRLFVYHNYEMMMLFKFRTSRITLQHSFHLLMFFLSPLMMILATWGLFESASFRVIDPFATWSAPKIRSIFDKWIATTDFTNGTTTIRWIIKVNSIWKKKTYFFQFYTFYAKQRKIGRKKKNNNNKISRISLNIVHNRQQ